jgi:hypothetical protein
VAPHDGVHRSAEVWQKREWSAAIAPPSDGPILRRTVDVNQTPKAGILEPSLQLHRHRSGSAETADFQGEGTGTRELLPDGRHRNDEVPGVRVFHHAPWRTPAHVEQRNTQVARHQYGEHAAKQVMRRDHRENPTDPDE